MQPFISPPAKQGGGGGGLVSSASLPWLFQQPPANGSSSATTGAPSNARKARARRAAALEAVARQSSKDDPALAAKCSVLKSNSPTMHLPLSPLRPEPAPSPLRKVRPVYQDSGEPRLLWEVQRLVERELKRLQLSPSDMSITEGGSAAAPATAAEVVDTAAARDEVNQRLGVYRAAFSYYIGRSPVYGAFLQDVQHAYEEALVAAEERAAQAVVESDEARFKLMQLQRMPMLAARMWQGAKAEQSVKIKDMFEREKDDQSKLDRVLAHSRRLELELANASEQLRRALLANNELQRGPAAGSEAALTKEQEHDLRQAVLLAAEAQERAAAKAAAEAAAAAAEGGEAGAAAAAATSAPAADSGRNKFCGHESDLVGGSLVLAGRGLAQFLSLDHDTKARCEEAIKFPGRSVPLIEEECAAFPHVRDLLHYVLHEPCTEVETTLNGRRDAGRQGQTLADFVAHPAARNAGLSEAHVVALRLFTTQAFAYVNDPLVERRDDNTCATQHPLPVTLHFIDDALRKLLAAPVDGSASPTQTADRAGGPQLFRGMQNLRPSNDFLSVGGTSVAPTSTTSSLEVAVRSSLSGNSLLLKLAPGHRAVGVDVRWLSVYPEEDEVLLPPLCFLQPTGRWQAVAVTLEEAADRYQQPAASEGSGDPHSKRRNSETTTKELRITVVEVKPTYEPI